jgi:hypothetical protein
MALRANIVATVRSLCSVPGFFDWNSLGRSALRARDTVASFNQLDQLAQECNKQSGMWLSPSVPKLIEAVPDTPIRIRLGRSGDVKTENPSEITAEPRPTGVTLSA